MTLLDRPQQGLEQLAPMHLDADSVSDPLTDAYRGNVEDYREDLALLLREQPYRSGESFAIFRTPAISALSNPAKALDGTVRETDSNWQDSRDRTVASLGPIQENSFYFTYVDMTDPENPDVQGTLMVAEGEAETIAYFQKENPGADLPPEFVVEEGELMWDIVSVMVKKSARDQIKSARLYNALYENACEVTGISDSSVEQPLKMKWISSLSHNERVSLVDFLAIPFKEVEGIEPTFDELTNSEGEVVKRIQYDFCSLYVGDIRPSMLANIAKLEETKDPSWDKIIAIAKIALLGNPEAIIPVPEDIATVDSQTQAA